MKKWLIGAVATVIIILVVIPFFIFTKNRDTQDEIINVYNNNIEEFTDIAYYAKELEGNIYINNISRDKYTVEINENHEVSNFKITDSIIEYEIKHMLFKLNFEAISEEGNSVYFVKITGLGFDRGIIYMKDGRAPDGSNNVTKSKKIKDRWYYYENNN